MRKLDGRLAILWVLVIVLLAIGGVASGGTYLSLFNLQSMATQVPEIGLLAIGVMLAMCAGNGGIDLSGIALANLSGVASGLVATQLFSAYEAPWAFTLAFAFGALVVGALGGLLNGLIISRLGITPILCTLGTQMLFTGLAVVFSDGRSVTIGSPDPLYELGNGVILGVPYGFLIFLGVALVLGGVLRFTPFGMRLMLTGANARAADFSGFSKNTVFTVTYTLSGALAGLSGVIIAARNVNVKWDYGTSYLLIAILIAVMAGVRPEGGYGRVFCVVLSAVVLQLLSSLLNFIGLSNFVRDFAWGALLLAFLAVGRFELIERLAAGITSARVPRASKV
ncbi:sugar ABC transporter permease (plasmid) [Alloyangia pacifica]|uniref:Sugar ABC transporter permease n=1 Tax=Alloyangia pacifica TaxID=311180 RepID=A0A2U8HLF3_9RHOB|nr:MULTISPECIES: ABC transporter permease [Roseobacteraceae]AWI85936.1 sugar ABC transporter permease [Alloyangia pacifica]NDV52239.1 ABC transporter permease [Salipiger sp. PrR003]NDW31861.1 ABC transporter permease [Salipiger sp. PrR007]